MNNRHTVLAYVGLGVLAVVTIVVAVMAWQAYPGQGFSVKKLW